MSGGLRRAARPQQRPASGRWETLRPTIERLVEDRVLAVRSVAVNCLLAILDAPTSPRPYLASRDWL